MIAIDPFLIHKKKPKLAKSNHAIKISTFNVRTLQPISQISEVVASSKDYDIDIVCIQEHQFFHDDLEIKYHEIGNSWTRISVSMEEFDE